MAAHLADHQAEADETVKWLVWLTLVSLMLLAARWFALQFNATDLFFDEAQYWAWSEEPAFGYYSKPPLIAWIIGAATNICGSGEACIRAPSALIYVFAAFGIFAAASQLYGARTAFLSAVVFSTVPGVSLSAGIISTDVPLLAAWAWALAAFVWLLRGGRWPAAVALGIALGVGLNGKYAMAYFVLCALVYVIANPRGRWLIASAQFWLAIAIAVTMIAPNIAWNLDNGFATFSHTADNANWGGQLGNPGKALEFFGAQFGVFGPILFAGLLIVSWRAWRDGLTDADALLLCFAIPVILIVTCQAFVSRAHANWAAVSYVAASIVVTATMVRDRDWWWFRASLALHLAIAVMLAAALSFAGQFALPGGADPFRRTLGWEALAERIDRAIDNAQGQGEPIKTVLTDSRAMSSELLYYLRKRLSADDIQLAAWRGARPPKDHFTLKRPFANNPRTPVLYVSTRSDARDRILTRFRSQTPLGRVSAKTGQKGERAADLYKLEDYVVR
ncbi:MAG: glycosyltransferase family 39 protein [Pseudomonadota bacterium]